MGRIGVITNPFAKKNRKDPSRKSRLDKIVGQDGVVFETSKIMQLPKVCQDIAAQDIDLVCICGGDGTNHLVISDVIKAYENINKPLPPIHFLRGGSMNTISWNLGIKGKAENNLREILRKRKTGESFKNTQLGTIRINDQYGFFFGNGYAVNFLHEYYNSKFEGGPARAAHITYQTIASIATGGDMSQRLKRQFQSDVFVDGQKIDFPSFGMILASFIEYIGIGFKPMYRAREKEGYFHVVVSSNNLRQILAQVHKFFIGKGLTGQYHLDKIVREVRIISEEPLGYTIDGELYHSKDITISVGPAIKVIY